MTERMTPEQIACPHENFAVHADIQRLIDVGVFSAEIRIRCQVCQLPFSFKGFEMGWSPDKPMVNPDGTELRAPLEPGPSAMPVTGHMTFVMPQKSRES